MNHQPGIGIGISILNVLSTQDRAAPGVYDPLDTVSYFK